MPPAKKSAPKSAAKKATTDTKAKAGKFKAPDSAALKKFKRIVSKAIAELVASSFEAVVKGAERPSETKVVSTKKKAVAKPITKNPMPMKSAAKPAVKAAAKPPAKPPAKAAAKPAAKRPAARPTGSKVEVPKKSFARGSGGETGSTGPGKKYSWKKS